MKRLFGNRAIYGTKTIHGYKGLRPGSLLYMALVEGRTVSGGAEAKPEVKDLKPLTEEELDAYEGELKEQYKAAREAENPDLSKLTEIVEENKRIKAERDSRQSAAEALEALDAEMTTETPEPEPEPEATPEPTGDPEPEATPEPEPEADPVSGEVDVEKVAAQVASILEAREKKERPSISDIKARMPKDPRAPKAGASRLPFSVVASADVFGHSAGTELEQDPLVIGEAFAKKAQAMVAGGKAGRHPVVRFAVDYPDERKLNRDTDDAAKINAALEELSAASYGGLEVFENARTAAGGLCAPVAARYDMAMVSTAARPVRDALSMFQATRGGIRFITPPTITDVAGAVDVITEQEDTDDVTKTCLDITCGTEDEVLVSAIYLCLTNGNFNARFFPEQFQAWYNLALAQHAREAEGELLTLISAGSTAITDGQNLGAARDLLESHGRFAAQYRNRHRMPPTATLQLLAPAWMRDMIAADLAREAPGSAAERLAVSYAAVDSFYAVRNIAVTYYLDERPGSGQLYAAQTAGAGLPWITTVESYLFHPGAWLYLDGGTLDLGTEIRDSTLNSTNELQAFLESFEAAAFVGVESLRIRNSVCVSGEASIPIDFTCPGEGS